MTTPTARAREAPEYDYRSAAEAEYAERLKTQKVLGEIRLFDHEIASFSIARGVRYKPDFLVIRNDWTVELHEVKAVRRNKGKVEKWKTHPGDRDSRTRIHMAAQRLPYFRWIVAWKDGRRFELEEIPSS